MTPEISSNGDAQSRIDRKQRELDSADQKADGAIDHPDSLAERERMTRAYIGRVNDVQGRLGAMRREIERRKEMKSASWPALEQKCTEVERELVKRLESVDPRTMREGVDAFDAAIGQLMTGLEGAKERTETVTASPAVVRLLTQLKFPKDVVDACASSPAKLRQLLETFRDTAGRANADIADIREQEQAYLKQLAAETGGSTYGFFDSFTSKVTIENESVRATVERIKQLRVQIQTLSQKKQPIDMAVGKLEVAVRLTEADSARAAGETELADRSMAKLLEEHGRTLTDIDPDTAAHARTSAEALRMQGKLTPTEEALLFADPSSPEALSRAIEAKAAETPTADIVDQLQARETFKVGPFKTVNDHFGIGRTNVSVNYQGRNIVGALTNTLLTTLTYADKKIDVAVTPDAKTALEKIPAGYQPIILKPVRSMNSKFVAGGRGSMSYTVDAPPPSFIIQAYEVGYVDKTGKVIQSGSNTEIDVAKSPHRDAIESQLKTRRSFRTEDYKPAMELRSLANKPYPYRLLTLRTQSGITVEGVQISVDAQDVINRTPPAGKTLVLKRIPRAVSLRTPEQTPGRNSRSYQRVIDADIITKKDLAYASLNGDTAEITDTDGTSAQSVSAQGANKERDEHAHTIERVLDRNPAIHYVKQTASTIQQTVGHLQSFLQAGQTGSARDAFVSFAREEAKPTLELLRDAETLRNVEEAKRVLRSLKGSSGVASAGLEKQVDDQLRALEQFTALLSDSKTQNLLETIMDASKFDADSWNNFFANELPVIAASIVAACAAAALVVATMGTAAPFIAIAAATAAGGIIGSELGKEAVFQFRQLDADVQAGNKTFTARSRVGKYAEGSQQFNAATGQYEDQELFRDIASPLAQEFAFSFTVTLTTMGIGNVVGAGLSKVLQNTKVVEKLAARSDIMKVVARRLAAANTNKEPLARATGLKDAITRALKELPKETLEEAGEEAQEEALERFLNHLDLALAASDSSDGKLGLGSAAGVLLAIAGRTRIGKKTVTYERGAQKAAIVSELTARGAEVSDLGQGYLSVRHAVTAEGGGVQYETIQMMPEKITAAPPTPDEAPKAGGGDEEEEEEGPVYQMDVAEAEGSDHVLLDSSESPGMFDDVSVEAEPEQKGPDVAVAEEPSSAEETIDQDETLEGAPRPQPRPPTSDSSISLNSSGDDTGTAEGTPLRVVPATPSPEKTGPSIPRSAQETARVTQEELARQGRASSTDTTDAAPLGEGAMGSVTKVDVYGDTTGGDLPILEKDSYATKVSKNERKSLAAEGEIARDILAQAKQKAQAAAEQEIQSLPNGITEQEAAARIAKRIGRVIPIHTPALVGALLIARESGPNVSWETAVTQSLAALKGPVPNAYESQNAQVLPTDALTGVDGSKLEERTGELSPGTRESMAYGYILAVNSANGAGYVYRDLKPENVIVDPNGVMRLIDLGIVKKDGELTSAGGTPVTMAPEQVQRESIATVQSDVFSAGCNLYHLFSVTKGFPVGDSIKAKGKNATSMLYMTELLSITQQELDTLVDQNVDADPVVKDLIKRMLNKDPAQRPTMQEVQDTLYGRVEGHLEADRRELGTMVRTTMATNDALKIAPQKNTTALKQFFLSTDPGNAARLRIASAMLGIMLSPEQQAAIIAAHNLPGEIDNLTDGQKTAKGLALMRNTVFTREQAQLLLDAGICGNPATPTAPRRIPVPPPPPRKPDSTPAAQPSASTPSTAGRAPRTPPPPPPPPARKPASNPVNTPQTTRVIPPPPPPPRKPAVAPSSQTHSSRNVNQPAAAAPTQPAARPTSKIPPPPPPPRKAGSSAPESTNSAAAESPALDLFRKSTKWNQLDAGRKRTLEESIRDHVYDDMETPEEADFIIDIFLDEQKYEARYGESDKKDDAAAAKLLSSSDVFSDAEKKILKSGNMSHADLVEYMRFYNNTEGPEWVTLFHATTDVEGITKGIDPNKLTSDGLGATKGETKGTLFLTPDYNVAMDYLKAYRKMGKGEKAGIVAVRIRRNDPHGTSEGAEVRLTNPMTQDMINRMGPSQQATRRPNILWIRPIRTAANGNP